ncbi:hypothetical protein [Bacteriovorax sp. Seq25_V]|uniref:hypothetical protein n=1 Tax=Bacteriovorax sp. Seq25_V TaxID=1201288 RepID=UPI00038A0CD8|nr:hypothetical protein [Bacteriovorax sp. Seq25_V]EQC47467.1 hypothetical protein M900_0853 [Bacteriovorax sp. Seq25_V]
MKKIVRDFWNEFTNSPYSNEMEKKYWNKLDVTISDTVKYLIENKIDEKLIKNIFHGDTRDSQTPYLLKIDESKYEVFESERGEKYGLHTYTSLEEALFNYVDTVYNSYGICSSDSKINSEL